MNNLEKIKEINPKLYEQIKLKYITNAQGLKTHLDIFPSESIEKNFSNDTSLEEFIQFLKRYELVNEAQKQAQDSLENAQKLLKIAEKIGRTSVNELFSLLEKDA